MKISRKDLRVIVESHVRLNEVFPLLPFAAPVVASAGGTAFAGFTAAGWAVLGTTITGLLAGATWWATRSDGEQDRIRDTINDLGLHEAFAIYSALKGIGTNAELVGQMIGSKASAELQADYAKVLTILDETDDGGLIEWLRDDGMDDAAKDLLIKMSNGA